MGLPGWLWLGSAVLAACGTAGLGDPSTPAACPVRMESGGECEGGRCPFQLTLPALAVQLPQQLGSLEKVLEEVRTLRAAVDRLQRSCMDCRLQADERLEPGAQGSGADGVRELENRVSRLSAELSSAKNEIQGLRGRLDMLHLVNFNSIENYVDNKVANLTSVVNSLDGKCSKCPGQEHRQSQPVQHLIYKDCSEYYAIGKRSSETYRVAPDPKYSSFAVFCDMETMGGGWTVLQVRLDGSTNFTRGWEDYKVGFGNLEREFWLGNDKIHLLTKNKEMILRVDLEDFNNVKLYALYDRFYVASEFLKYQLHIGNYNGTAGDALRFSRYYNHDLKFFTTPDRDNDRYPSGNCGLYYSSGWWFDACLSANLNGKYYHQRYKGVRNGIFWGTWPGISQAQPGGYKFSFKKAKMMIRPKNFKP